VQENSETREVLVFNVIAW